MGKAPEVLKGKDLPAVVAKEEFVRRWGGDTVFCGDLLGRAEALGASAEEAGALRREAEGLLLHHGNHPELEAVFSFYLSRCPYPPLCRVMERVWTGMAEGLGFVSPGIDGPYFDGSFLCLFPMDTF